MATPHETNVDVDHAFAAVRPVLVKFYLVPRHGRFYSLVLNTCIAPGQSLRQGQVNDPHKDAYSFNVIRHQHGKVLLKSSSRPKPILLFRLPCLQE